MMPADTDVPIIIVKSSWTIDITRGATRIVHAVRPPDIVAVGAERYERMPVFDATLPGWRKGERLRGVIAEETTAMGALDPSSVVVRSAPAGGAAFVQGRDYALDPEWGTLGRLPDGAIDADAPVFVDYRYGLGRLDALVQAHDGRVLLREGTPAISLARLPAVAEDETHIASIWLTPRLATLSDDHIFPVTEHAFPARRGVFDSATLPRALGKLERGEPLTILAWGDSVTDGSFLPSSADRWQEQFVERLLRRYPQAQITLATEAWGGHTTMHYFAEPPGAPHNYAERVLAVRPDLLISEFVNDAGLPLRETAARYERILRDVQGIGAEWIILTPHYVRPDWMNLDGEKQIDDDPRPYVAFVRRFAADHAGHGVAVADAAARWGRLWRQGIPYTTLLSNAINHPDGRGMRLYADALLGEEPARFGVFILN